MLPAYERRLELGRMPRSSRFARSWPGSEVGYVPRTRTSSRGAWLSDSGPLAVADDDVLDARTVPAVEVDARLDAESVAHLERPGIAGRR